jgi:hypothetical protein
MLTELRIKNFKAWKDTGPIPLAPLTVIFGANSAGKSSLGHLLLALKQTALLTDRKRALHLGDANSPIDLGTFADCLHDHDVKAKLELTLGWRLPSALTLSNPLQPGKGYTGDTMRLESIIRADRNDQPQTESFEYTLLNGGAETLRAHHWLDEKGKPKIEAKPLNLVMKVGRKWPIEAPEKFYRFADVTLARYQNADALTEFPLQLERMLAGLTYLGPLREPPKRTYPWAGDSVPDVGQRGERAISALLSARQGGLELNRGYRRPLKPFDVFIAEWLRDLGVIDQFEVKPVAKGRKDYEVLVRTTRASPQVKLTDVGFGVSQVLPALVQAFYAQPDTTVWMEQPEIHLHPRVQAELADVFISAVQSRQKDGPRNVQLIVESHSEAFLMRLQRRIAEDLIRPEDVAVYFVRQTPSGVDLEALKLDMFGEIENWPEDFFGDEMSEIVARTTAAVSRRQKARSTHD